MNARWIRIGVSPAMLITVTLSGVARGEQPPAEKEARATLAEAHKLGKRGDFEGACRLFEKSAEQAPSADALLNAGICREYHADLAGALEAFERALEASRDRPRQQAAIQPRIDALRPRVPTVAIAPPPTAATVVEIDARTVERFGTPLRMNPGEHQLRVTAPGGRPHSESFSLTPGQVLTLSVPELVPEAPAPAQAPVLPTPRAKAAGDPLRISPEQDGASGWRQPLVFGGLGLFVAGGAFSVWQFIEMSQARSRKHDLADEHACNIDGERAPGPSCDASVRDRLDAIYRDDEEPARKRAWVGLAASGVGAAAALIGYFALPGGETRPAARAKPGSTALQLQPALELGPSVYSAQLRARW